MKTLEIPVRKIQPEIPFCRCSWIGNDTTRIFPNINNRPDYVVFVNRRWFTAPCRNCVTYFRRVVAFAIRVIAFTSGVIPTFLSIAIRYHIVHRLFKSLTSTASRTNLRCAPVCLCLQTLWRFLAGQFLEQITTKIQTYHVVSYADMNQFPRPIPINIKPF